MTVAGSIVLGVAAITVITIGIIHDKNAREISQQQAEMRRQQNATYERQLGLLNETEVNLKNLIEFVELEKQRLQQSEKALNDLKNQEQLLKPIVESDRRTVESLLEFQNQRAQDVLTRERWYAFGLGILTSILASIVIAIVRLSYKYLKRKSPTPRAEPVPD